MATRQPGSKSPRPVTASPTSRPPKAKPVAARKPAASKATAADSTAPARANGTPANGAQANGAPVKRTDSQQAVVPSAPGIRGRSAAVARSLLRPIAVGWRAAARWSGGRLGAAARWSGGGLPFATFVLSVLGLADAIDLTIDHFSNATTFLGCSEHGAINCLAVTTSNWSRIPAGSSGGIPVSVLGLAFFVFMVAVNSRWGWRSPWAIVHWARLASVLIGIVMVLYLVWAELFRINAICLYCTGVHIITFILFALIISRFVISGIRGAGATDNG